MENSQGRNNICLLGISEENQNNWKELISETIIQENFPDRPLNPHWKYIKNLEKLIHKIYIITSIYLSEILFQR